jgi:hypothetical protein
MSTASFILSNVGIRLERRSGGVCQAGDDADGVAIRLRLLESQHAEARQWCQRLDQRYSFLNFLQ